MPPTHDGFLPPGTAVTVRARFDGRWSGGFEVAEVITDPAVRYRLRRVSDNTTLPVSFAADDVIASRDAELPASDASRAREA